jgi:hypothetical protein
MTYIDVRSQSMSTHQILAICGIAIFLIAVFIAVDCCRISRSRSILQKWAAWNGLQILSYKRAFWTGVFNPFTTARSQVVFWVRVRDGAGHDRSGWVRCGSFWGGLARSQAEVKWESNAS